LPDFRRLLGPAAASGTVTGSPSALGRYRIGPAALPSRAKRRAALERLSRADIRIGPRLLRCGLAVRGRDLSRARYAIVSVSAGWLEAGSRPLPTSSPEGTVAAKLLLGERVHGCEFEGACDPQESPRRTVFSGGSARGGSIRDAQIACLARPVALR
jgi:hypothetical protein